MPNTTDCVPSTTPELSVVVPAYNEEKLLGETLAVLSRGLPAAGFAARQFDITVTDNASTDATARIAEAAGARVVHEPDRQIARARNAGARDAAGRWLLFVDADTRPSVALLSRARALMRAGTVCGGGALVDPAGAGPFARLAIGAWNTVSRSAGLACGAFLFCRADGFRAIGGFDETLYAAEEVDLSWRLARWGRTQHLAFRIITRERLDTSLRKLELYRPAELAAMMARGLLRPHRVLKERRFLDHWYDGRR